MTAAEKEVAKWNASVKVGDSVEYRELEDSAPEVLTTRFEASVLSGHTAVVWLNGKRGCVCLDHCRKVGG